MVGWNVGAGIPFGTLGSLRLGSRWSKISCRAPPHKHIEIDADRTSHDSHKSFTSQSVQTLRTDAATRADEPQSKRQADRRGREASKGLSKRQTARTSRSDRAALGHELAQLLERLRREHGDAHLTRDVVARVKRFERTLSCGLS